MKKSAKRISKTKRKIFYIIINIAIFSIMIFLRTFDPNVYKDSDTIFLKDPDTCYHARRIIYIATNNMQLPFYDPLIAHPVGAVPRWPPLYDWLCALPAFCFSFGNPSHKFIITISSLFNLALGLASLLVIELLIFNLTNKFSIAAVATIMSGASYPSIKYTSKFNFDHNSLLIFLFICFVYLTYRVVIKPETKLFSLTYLLLSCMPALLFWTWTGSYIYILIIAFLQIAIIFSTKNFYLLPKFALTYLISCLLILPLVIINWRLKLPLFKLGYISLFTLTFLLIPSLSFYILFKLINLIKISSNKIIVLISIITLLAVALAIYLMSDKIIEGFKIASASNAWLSSISESQSLLFKKNDSIKIFTLDKCITFFGFSIFIYPISFLLICIKKIKTSTFLYYLIIITSLFFGFLSFNQQKYAAELSIPYGIATSIFIIWLYENFFRKKLIFLILIIIFLLITLTPIRHNFADQSQNYIAHIYALKWLAGKVNLNHTEINSGRSQEIGVMAPWDLGHHIKFYANMPTVADNFGMSILPYQNFYAMARFFLSETEDEAVSILKEYKSPYIIIPSITIFEHYPAILNLNQASYFNYNISIINSKKQIVVEPKPKFYHTMAFKLGYLYGSANPFSKSNFFISDALKHFRLIYESPSITISNNKIEAGNIKIYKLVDGYQIKLDNSKDLHYNLEAPILTNTNRIFYYRQSGKINDNIIVPYPTGSNNNYPYALYYIIKTDKHVYEFRNLRKNNEDD